MIKKLAEARRKVRNMKQNVESMAKEAV